jgi:hypothetical protein
MLQLLLSDILRLAFRLSMRRQSPNCIVRTLQILARLSRCTISTIQCGLREENTEDSKCVDCLKRIYGCCCCCCIAFLFRCFHRAAYTYQNLTGLPYCQSSYEVNDLIRCQKDKWIEKWSTIASLCMVLKNFVPFAIIIITILVANLCIDNIAIYQANTTDRILIFWILALMSYAIAKFFIGIYA